MTKTTKKLPALPHGATLCFGRRDTRWDVYPQREPKKVIAHGWEGFFDLSQNNDGAWFWFKTPASFALVEKGIDEARAFEVWECEACGAQWTDRPVGHCYQCEARQSEKAVRS